MNVAQTNLQLYGQLLELGASPAEIAAARSGYELAAALFAGVYRASGKQFVAHVVGTASVLLQDGAAGPIVRAGLIHAAYAQGDFGDGQPGVTGPRRRRLCDAIGEEAEDLVFRYTTLPWRTGDLSGERGRLASLGSTERDVVRMRLANEVEELVDFGSILQEDGEDRRAKAMASLPVWIEWAAALSADAIAAELVAKAVALHDFRVPDGLRTDRVRSYRPGPALRPTAAARARSAMLLVRAVGRKILRPGTAREA
ncbi:MAG: DUF6817 domain-containing protein [Acidobacteriota bacterium]